VFRSCFGYERLGCRAGLGRVCHHFEAILIGENGQDGPVDGMGLNFSEKATGKDFLMITHVKDQKKNQNLSGRFWLSSFH